MRIDLNSDLGEEVGGVPVADDEAMLRVVTSANIACGFHAGDPHSLTRTLELAAHYGTAVGAHVSYQDLEGFGRRDLDVSAAALTAGVIYQIGALEGLARAAGTRVRYIKPHGALYNAISHEERADAVIRAILAVGPDYPLVVLAGSPLVDQATAAGLLVVPEAFADRAYEPDGTLVSRRKPGAVLEDPAEVAERMLRLASTGTLLAIDGTPLHLAPRSICVHGDSPGAVAMALATRSHLQEAGIELAPFAD